MKKYACLHVDNLRIQKVNLKKSTKKNLLCVKLFRLTFIYLKYIKVFKFTIKLLNKKNLQLLRQCHSNFYKRKGIINNASFSLTKSNYCRGE